MKHKFDPINEYVVTTILEEPKSLEEYIARIPSDFKDLVKVIVEKFEGGPVSYIQIAKELKIPGMEAYEKLEHLVSLGFLVGDPRGNYKVPDYVRKFLEEKGGMNYEEHVLLGLGTYPLFVLLAYILSNYLPLKLTFPSLILGYAFYVLGSDLPDIDHPDSLIHRGIKPIFSVILGSIVAVKVYPYLNVKYALVVSWIVGGAFALIGWFLFSAMMPRHRGIIHSVLFAVIYGIVVFFAVKYGTSLSNGEAYLVGFASFMGYLLHLIADKSVKLL